MGKKAKDKKKGAGSEKTALKTEKNLSSKHKKQLAKMGEDDIETILKQIEEEESRREKVIEHLVESPSRRINFTFISHPIKDELILHGGEFYNGQKLCVYNDLFFYNIANRTWTVLKSPKSPPPRCGHQMISTSMEKGQLWMFGGEYASPSQNQFYHYRDLWVYHIAAKKWDKIMAANGPSARSGHRMVCSKKRIFVFGGFHDNLCDYKYFNDVHVFNMDTYAWHKLEPTGFAPAPRSGCCMVALADGKILIYGGYSKEKIKKDVDKGHVFSDAFILTPDKNDTSGLKYKWVPTKIGGVHFPSRCSMPMTIAPNNNSAYCFGGVYDTTDDEEELAGKFYNDLHQLDTEKLVWRTVNVRGKQEKAKLKEDEKPTDDINMEIVKEIETTSISDDGVFKVTVSSLPTQSTSLNSAPNDDPEVFHPSPRLNCGLAIKNGVLYLYGGMFEDGDKEITYQDFYSIDLKKLDEWKTINTDDLSAAQWLGSPEVSSDDDEDESSDENEENSDCTMVTETDQ